MKIKETKLGNGLSRFEVIPMFDFEKNTPTEAVDAMVKDIISKKRNGTDCHEDFDNDDEEVPSELWGRTCFCQPGWKEIAVEDDEDDDEIPLGWLERHELDEDENPREPDGIDVHVDRPTRPLFTSNRKFKEALNNYRNLEKIAKKCDWPCKDMPFHKVEDKPRCAKIEEPKAIIIEKHVQAPLFDDDDIFNMLKAFLAF